MLAILRDRLPGVRATESTAEEIAAADSMYDVVIGAQCFHWFDHDKALPEIARVLKPGGRIALVWNIRDERIPWVRRLGRIIGSQEQDVDPTEVLVGSRLFGYVEEAAFRHWQPLRRAELRDLALSRSNVAVLDPSARDRVLRKVDELFDAYSRGPDGLLLPYVAKCYRAVVRPRGLIDEPEHSADLTAAAEAARAATRPAPAAPDDPAPTLIDFR